MRCDVRNGTEKPLEVALAAGGTVTILPRATARSLDVPDREVKRLTELLGGGVAFTAIPFLRMEIKRA